MLRRLAEIIAAAASISSGGLRAELSPPDVIIERGSRVIVNRYLVVRGSEPGAEAGEAEIVKRARAFAGLLGSLPTGVEVRILKGELDLSSYLRRLANDMANLAVDLEHAEDPRRRARLSARLRSLRKIYEGILSGRSYARISLYLRISVDGEERDKALSKADYYEKLCQLTLREALGLVAERPGRLELLDLWLSDVGVKPPRSNEYATIEAAALGAMASAPVRSSPAPADGLLLGFEKETGHPLAMRAEELYKHVAVIGPTGRGKTTLLASIIEELASKGISGFIAVDFKGDMPMYVAGELVEVINHEALRLDLRGLAAFPATQQLIPLIAESIAFSLGISAEEALEDIEGLASSVPGRPPRSPSGIALLEAFEEGMGPGDIEGLISRDFIADLSGEGSVMQNLHACLLIGMLRLAAQKSREGLGKVLIIDDAWRVTRFRALAELIKEGRSRRAGVALASQNPGDFPRDILENIHTFLIFGSPNRDYAESAEAMLGVEGLGRALRALGIGEALYMNALERHPRAIRINTPAGLR